MLYSETVVAGLPEFRPNVDITVVMRLITRKGSNRVAREAFEIARTRERKKVTAAHKEPGFRLACGRFAEECRKVAREYPDVTFEEMMIDSISMKLVTAPQQFDVVVTTNQFGDILTDIGAGLVGGLGLAPGLCVGERQAMAQATHGSAPDIAGRNIANPYAMIIFGEMRLGQQVYVENRGGANGAIGLQALMVSDPDGYTIAMSSDTPLVVNPSLYEKLPYSPLRDFVPVATTVKFPGMLLAHPSVPARTV